MSENKLPVENIELDKEHNNSLKPIQAETNTTKEPIVNIGFYLDTCRKYWWMILISLVLCIGLATLYLIVKSPVYLLKSMVMVNQNDDDEGGSIGGGALGALMTSFSMGNSSVNIEDEILRLNSQSGLKQVVKDLDLNALYWSRDSYLRPKTSYFRNSPINISMPESVLDTLSEITEFKICIPEAGKPVSISAKQDGKQVCDTEISTFPCKIKTPYGTFTISLTEYFKPGKKLNLKATIDGYDNTIDDLREAMAINQISKKGNAIILDIEDSDKLRGKAILNKLIENYNQDGIDFKNKQALASAKFIEDRLLSLYHDLTSSEADIEKYKRNNNLVDPEIEADYTFKLKGTVEEKALEIQIKASVLKMLRDYLSSPSNKYNLVPFAEDIPELPIESYNTLVLERMRLETNIKGNDNVALRTLTAQVDAMRSNIMVTLDKQIQSTNIALSDINRQIGTSSSRINQAPTFERELRSLYRDQEIKNRIYGFLLQKREENQMKISKNVAKAVVIDEAYSLIEPVKPNKVLLIIGGIILGLLLGVGSALFLQKKLDK